MTFVLGFSSILYGVRFGSFLPCSDSFPSLIERRPSCCYCCLRVFELRH